MYSLVKQLNNMHDLIRYGKKGKTDSPIIITISKEKLFWNKDQQI